MATTSPDHDRLSQELTSNLTKNLTSSLHTQGKQALQYAQSLTNNAIATQGLHLCFECASPLLKATPHTPAATAVQQELRSIANHIPAPTTLHRVSAAKTKHYTNSWLPDAALLQGREFEHAVPNDTHPPPIGPWICIGHTRPPAYNDITTQARSPRQERTVFINRTDPCGTPVENAERFSSDVSSF